MAISELLPPWWDSSLADPFLLEIRETLALPLQICISRVWHTIDATVISIELG